MREFFIIDWPESQLCLGCKHSEFVESERTLISSNYICHVKSRVNDGLSCPFRLIEDEETNLCEAEWFHQENNPTAYQSSQNSS